MKKWPLILNLLRLKRNAKKCYKDGVEEGSKENAKNAIGLGLDNETISKITGLSVEKIEKIRNSLNENQI